jgi:hypothetical protein
VPCHRSHSLVRRYRAAGRSLSDEGADGAPRDRRQHAQQRSSAGIAVESSGEMIDAPGFVTATLSSIH